MKTGVADIVGRESLAFLQVKPHGMHVGSIWPRSESAVAETVLEHRFSSMIADHKEGVYTRAGA